MTKFMIKYLFLCTIFSTIATKTPVTTAKIEQLETQFALKEEFHDKLLQYFNTEEDRYSIKTNANNAHNIERIELLRLAQQIKNNKETASTVLKEAMSEITNVLQEIKINKVKKYNIKSAKKLKKIQNENEIYLTFWFQAMENRPEEEIYLLVKSNRCNICCSTFMFLIATVSVPLIAYYYLINTQPQLSQI